GATEELLVLRTLRIELHDVGHGDTMILPGGQLDRVALAEVSLAQDREVEPGAPGTEELLHDLGTLEPDAELEAREPWLGDDEFRGAHPQTISDAHLRLEEPLAREVLAER